MDNPLRVQFIEHRQTKYGPIDYTFIDGLTKEEIAFGSYNGAKGFDLIDYRSQVVTNYPSAAVAWGVLMRELV